MASAFSDDRIRHSTALMVVLDIFPQIMRDMICHDFNPNTVSTLIRNQPRFLQGLNSMEKKMISDMGINGYNSLDISIFYKIIRFFCLLPIPNQRWGNRPASGDIGKGDDVERMRYLRNDVFHRPAGSFSELEKNDFFQQSIEIARRMDTRNGSSSICYESKVIDTRSFAVTRESHTQLLEKCVEYQARLQEIAGAPSFDLFYGNDIRIRMDAQGDNLASGGRTNACILFLRDPDFDVNAVIQTLDVIKEYLRRRNFAMSLEDATNGSLKLHLTIQDKCFLTRKILHKTIQSFLHEFFLAASIPFKHGHSYTVVLGESDYFIGDNENKNDLDYLKENPSAVLKLNLNVNDSAFQNELLLYREVNSFIAGIYNAVDMPFNGSAREVLMIADNEIGRDSIPTSTNIQDSQQRMQVAVKLVSETESNYFKICILIFKISPRAVRIKFDDVIQPENLRYTLGKNLSKLTSLKDKGCINQMQWNSMFPRTNDPTSQTFDTSLMICLLRNLAGIQIPNELPFWLDLSVGVDLLKIMTYRKDISNSIDRTFQYEKFTAIWKEIEDAVIRLTDEKLTIDCSTLKTTNFYVEDSERIYAMIQAAKRLVQIEEINEEPNRFKKQQSGKKQDFFNKEIQDWEEEKKWFVKTNAFNFIRQHLDERLLVVVGNPGMGKSMLLHQTALYLKTTKRYTVFSCLDASDIVSQFSKYTKQVFILDDACGRFTLVKSSIDRWKQYEINIARVLESKQAIILASCRSQIFQEKQCQSLSIFSGCVCDLNADCAITKQEKLNIANNYLSQNTIVEIGSDFHRFDMFPLLCRLYKDREIKRAVSCFQNPFKEFKTELDSFNNKDGGLRCCSLFLCVIHGGSLNEAKLMDETESEFSRTLQAIFEKFDINKSISRKNVLDSLDTHLNIYLKKKDGQYSVLHDRLLDFLFYYFGQRYQQLIINFADSEMIRDRTLLKSLDIIPQEFTVIIDRQNATDYFQRLVKDMLSDHINDVLYNHQMIHKDFRSKLVSHLQKLNDDDLTVTYVFSSIILDTNKTAYKILPLNFACRYGYTELSDFFLSKTKDINAYDGNNIPLITACRKDDPYLTELLLDKGADVNQTDALGCSPLLWSCVYGNLNIIKMLINKGAKVENIEVCSKSSPFIWACIGELLYICKSARITEEFRGFSNVNEFISILVENTNEHFSTQEHVIDVFLTVLRHGYLRGCIVAKEKYAHGTPSEFVTVVQNILRIIDKGDIEVYRDVGIQTSEINQTSPFIEIMNLFFDRGVDINKSSIGGITALSFACMIDMHKSQSVSYLLSKGASVNEYDIDETYPLQIAMRLGKEGLVQSLIGNGAIVNFSDGMSPILWAINKQNLDIVDNLIKAGAIIGKRYKNGTSLLHCAIRSGNDEILKLLLKEGISVNCKDDLGNTPLMIAVNLGLLNIVAVLITEGANVNAQNNDMATPLTLASMKGLTEIVRCLIANGADMYNSNEYGGNSLILACLHNYLEVVKVFIDNGCNIESIEPKKKQTCLSVASFYGFDKIVEYLIEHGANVNTKSYIGTTPLMLAASNGHLNIVKMLIKNNADVNLQDDKGSTCLIKASSKGYNGILTYLIDKKASINKVNNSRETPLMVAIMKGHTSTVKILLKRGAKMDIKNKKGLTAFDIAQQKNNSEISDLLLYFSQGRIKFHLPYLLSITFVIFLIWLYYTEK